MRRALVPCWSLLLLLSLACAGPASAYNRKAAKAYENGEASAKAGDWAAARRSFEEALSIDDGEGRIRVSGVKYMQYYPSLGLAEAAIELGDADAALAALARFDAIKKPGKDQEAMAASLRSRLSVGSGPDPGSPGGTGRPTPPSGPAPEALAAKKALDEGDLAGARRLARSAPTDAKAQEVLAAVDALLADKLTAARRDQSAGALSAAESKLKEVLEADPGNTAASSLLSSVRADSSSANDMLSDARAALRANRFDEAEDLARQARTRNSSLSADARALEREISQARRAPRTATPPVPESRRADGGKLLAGARTELDAGKLADARRKAGDALAADAGMKAEVEAVRKEIARRSEEADEILRRSRSAAAGGRFTEARQLATRAERLDRGMTSDAKRVRDDADSGEAEAQRLLVTIEAHLQSGAAASARSTVDELARAYPEHPQLTALRASVDGNGELVAGLGAYFRGDWVASIDALTPLVEANSGRSDLLAVLGCAHATRGLLEGAGGEQGQADLTRARELFAQALAANPQLQLDARYFSPRLRQLFEEARGT